MKNLLSLCLALLLLLTVTPVTAETLPLTGGWSAVVTEEDCLAASQALLALQREDAPFTAEYLLAVQPVSGMNYAVLCSDSTGWKIITLSVPLQGDPVLLREQVLVAVPKRPVCGGMGPVFGDVPEEDAAAISSAFDTLSSAVPDMFLVLGQQIVAGSNFLVLCRLSPADEASAPFWALATVYVDLDGNASLDTLDQLSFSADE